MNRSGFTLIELLVVIAIIAILAAILFPVFATAREKGRQAACASNLKQIGLAIAQYTSDFDETMPQGAMAGCGNQTPGNPCYEIDTWWSIQPYMKTHLTGFCPDVNGQSNAQNGQPANGIQGSYGINDWLWNCPGSGWCHGGIGTPWTRQLSLFTSPSSTILIGDGFTSARVVAGGGLADIIAPGVGSTELTGLTASPPTAPDGASNNSYFVARHTNACNFLWADGHVKLMQLTTVLNTVEPSSATLAGQCTYFVVTQ